MEKLKNIKLWLGDYKTDFKKIIFNYIIGYSSVLISIILLWAFYDNSFISVVSDPNIQYGILGCTISLLTTVAIIIEKDGTRTKMFPLFYIIFTLPIIGVMTYQIEADSQIMKTSVIYLYMIVGVSITFLYLVFGNNEERALRRKLEKQRRESQEFGEKSEKTNEVKINDKNINI